MAKVSTHFNLGRTQASLEFVDVDVVNDVPLFIDPGAIRLLGSPFARQCASTIQDFFTEVLTLMRAGKHLDAQALLSTLGEPNETHLGLSRGQSAGHGMADGLAEKLWEGLNKSKAVQTGLLTDLEETALFVDGVDRDIISDIVTNIIRSQLAQFTTAMAGKYGIPVQPDVPIVAWDRLSSQWVEELHQLPIVNGLPLLLVPRAFVRRRRGVYSADKYYRQFVIPYLQHQHLNSNSNLVRLLKDGTPRPPYKKTLMGMHPDVKATNTNVTEADPTRLKAFRDNAAKTYEVVGQEDLAKGSGSPMPDYDALLDDVLAVPPGDTGATQYHRAIEKLLTALFYPSLDSPVIEQDLHEGRKRIDIDYTNIARHGFFHWLHDVHGVQCSFVPVECKNYSRKLKNPEYDQLAGRFGVQRGFVGILCYRGFADSKPSVIQHCRDAAKDGRGYIIALDDDDLKALVAERKKMSDQDDFTTLWDRFKQLV